MSSINIQHKRDALAEILEACMLNMQTLGAPSGRINDLRALISALRKGSSDPAAELIGCDSDFGALVSSAVGRVLRRNW